MAKKAMQRAISRPAEIPNLKYAYKSPNSNTCAMNRYAQEAVPFKVSISG